MSGYTHCENSEHVTTYPARHAHCITTYSVYNTAL